MSPPRINDDSLTVVVRREGAADLGPFDFDVSGVPVGVKKALKPESTDRSLRGRDAGLPERSAGVPALAGRCRGRTGARSRRSAPLGGAEGAGARVRETCAGMLARASEPGSHCERASGRER